MYDRNTVQYTDVNTYRDVKTTRDMTTAEVYSGFCISLLSYEWSLVLLKYWHINNLSWHYFVSANLRALFQKGIHTGRV